MSFTDNYIKFTEKLGGPYFLMKKGIKRSTITSIMDGSTPSVETAYKIAKVLGVTVEDLVEEKPLGNAVVEHLTGYDGPEGQKESNNLTREGKEVRMEDIKKRLKNRIDEITEDEQLKTLQRIVDGWEFENIKRRTEEDKKIHPETQKKNNTA